MKNTLPILFALLMLPAAPIAAQEWLGGVNLTGAFPRGELADNLVDDGIGASFYALRRFKQSPWYAGGSFTAVTYGDRTFEVEPCCGFDLDELKVRNNIQTFHAVLRWQPEQLPLRPYGEAFAGVSRFETTTRLGDDFDDSYDNTDSVTDDSTFSGGLGGGLLYAAWNNPDGLKLSLELGARYLFGSDANYVREETVTFDGFDLGFLEERSKTDLFTVHVGVHFRF